VIKILGNTQFGLEARSVDNVEMKKKAIENLKEERDSQEIR
jgi:hypothetical protein